MRIDSHVHVWTDGQPPFTHNNDMSESRPNLPGPVEALIGFMDKNNIDKTVLIQCMYHGYDNSYMCHCIGRFPDRLTGVALFEPRAPGGPHKLEKFYREHGVQGMRLYPIKEEDASWLSAEDQIPLWEKAREIGVPFIWFGKCRQLPHLETMLRRFPEVPVIIDHLGEPELSEGVNGTFQNLVKLAECPNLYVKATRINGLSNQDWPYEDVHPFVRAVYDSFGPERMLACSGFPENPERGDARGFRIIEEAIPFFTDADKEWILGKTAAAIYR
jgi:predicted TIM-barrel fold metal-dependent hydrolase